MAVEWWLGGAGVLAVGWILVKKLAKDTLSPAILAATGREPDHAVYFRGVDNQKIFHAYVAEKKLYVGPLYEKFDRKHFFEAHEVRSWNIVHDVGMNNGRSYRTGFTVRIEVRRIDTPLITLGCGKNEQLAYRITEILNQTFGEQPVE